MLQENAKSNFFQAFWVGNAGELLAFQTSKHLKGLHQVTLGSRGAFLSSGLLRWVKSWCILPF